MKTALAIVELDEKDHCLPQPPIKILEIASPEEIIANLDILIDGYPVRDAAYNAMLKIRFLAEKLYQDTANPNNPKDGYNNLLMFLVLSNWDNSVLKIKDVIKQKHQLRLELCNSSLKKVSVIYQNEKELIGVNMLLSGMDFLKEYLQTHLSSNFDPQEFKAVIGQLNENKPVYATQLNEIFQNLNAVFVSKDAVFEDVEKVNEFFRKAQEGVSFLEKSEFNTKK